MTLRTYVCLHPPRAFSPLGYNARFGLSLVNVLAHFEFLVVHDQFDQLLGTIRHINVNTELHAN